MKRCFFDLHVFPDQKSCGEMAWRAKELGFKALGASVRDASSRGALKGIFREMERAGVEVLSRLDLEPGSSRSFSAEVEGARSSFDLVAAECSTRRDLVLAAKSRVDVVFVEPGAPLGLREGDFKPLVSSGKFFELNLRPLLRKRGLERARELSHLTRGLAWLLKLKVPLILSSGAVSPLELRSPLDMVSFFSLAGLSLEEGLRGVSKNPGNLLETKMAGKGPVNRAHHGGA